MGHARSIYLFATAHGPGSGQAAGLPRYRAISCYSIVPRPRQLLAARTPNTSSKFRFRLDAAMVFEYRNQPWRGIYLGYQSVLTVFRIPVWILLSVPKALRPRRSWTFKKTILMRLFNLLSPFQDLISKYVFHLPSRVRRLRFLSQNRISVPPTQPSCPGGKARHKRCLGGTRPRADFG